ncbi:flagellar export chaperone FliS [Anaerosporobacter faecicola]|uniref:flagellar export chaperone FliS n=1 Tax=Anaerosporobacter faecicola TaxID=2718714 RepID=UPI001439423B|nr:flagellar export chaperone FliS [Anaerosporobacter faecicola]
MAFNYAAAYQNNKVQTATKGELTLMLYDAGIKFVNKAILAIEKKDIQSANNNIKKAEDVIVEFRSTLDHKYAVAHDFDVVYDHMYRRLVEANIKKDKAILEAVLVDFKEMRDIWSQVMKQARIQGNK